MPDNRRAWLLFDKQTSKLLPLMHPADSEQKAENFRIGAGEEDTADVVEMVEVAKLRELVAKWQAWEISADAVAEGVRDILDAKGETDGK